MNVARISGLLLLVALVASPRMSSAQWWGGGASHHHNHHHHDAAGHRVDDYGHHIDNHGNHTGSWGVYDGDHSNELYYYNSTPRYSGQRSTYYAPSSSTYVSPNVLPRPAQPRFRGKPIEITCPANLEGSVNYALNGYKYTIRSGESQVIQSDRAWTVAFDRGSDFGMAKYSLSPGTYEFSVTEKGWELLKQRPSQPEVAAAPAPPAPAPRGDDLSSALQ